MDASTGAFSTTDEKPVTPGSVVFAMRPWSWTASLIPILLAAELEGQLCTLATLRLILMGVFVQSAANLINSFFDLKSGVDTKEAGDASILGGHISSKLCLPVSFVLLVCAGAASWDFFQNTMFLHCFLVGIVISVFYTAPPFPLKYHALGDVAIFVAFGPLLMQAVSAALTGELDSKLYYYCIPTSLLTEAILWANNARDIDSDTKANVYTVCRALGFQKSKLAFQLITYGAYVGCVFLAWQRQGFGLLLPLLTLPIAVKTCNAFQLGEEEMKDADERSAQLHLPFGLMMVIGIAVDCFTLLSGTCEWTR